VKKALLIIGAFAVLCAFAAIWYSPLKTIANRTLLGAGDEPDLPPELKDKADKEAFMERRNEYFALLRGIEEGKPFDPKDRVEGTRKMEAQEAEIAAMPDSAQKNSLLTTWTSIGPAPIPDGQTQSPRTAVSGRTVAIAVHPTNPDIVYVGAAQGGLYRSVDGGTIWTPLTDNALSLASGAIAIDPTAPDTVWYGTGEASFSADGYFGVGLYRIKNASTATPILEGPINAGTGGGDVFTGRSISEILINPTNPDEMFVSTVSGTAGLGGSPQLPVVPDRAVYRSSNATSANPTFTKMPVSPANGGNRSVIDMVADPTDFNRLIVAVTDQPISGVAQNDGGVYLSTNALSANPTFTRTLVTGINTSDSRTELALHRNPTSGILTIYAASGLLGGTVHKSTDGGQTWTQTAFISPVRRKWLLESRLTAA
jgi:hypothetical protein